MKIEIVTIREIPDDCLDVWASKAFYWLDPNKLRKKTQVYISTDEIKFGVYTTVKTIVRIIK